MCSLLLRAELIISMNSCHSIDMYTTTKKLSILFVVLSLFLSTITYAQQTTTRSRQDIDTIIDIGKRVTEYGESLIKRLKGNGGMDNLLKVDDTSGESPPVSRESVYLISEALAYDIGRVYQMGHNCESEIENCSPSMTAGLFIKYFNEEEVQLIMYQYESGMNGQKGKDCDIKELQSLMLALIERMANYIKLATPYTRPYSQ